ncbi:MAG: Cys-Gln thioester bond-forming surface protein [Oscillospiraceae bacterium]|jgi:TQXA domain-containing protein|nr:Cys-Gln thioester bond-forming surface protein [Oscillospiraceae bacterium]
MSWYKAPLKIKNKLFETGSFKNEGAFFMPKKAERNDHFMKKPISFLLAIIMIVSIFLGIGVTVNAAPGTDTDIYCYGGFGSPNPLEYRRNDTGEWVDISCPYWRTRDTLSVSYCLESDAEGPTNDQGYKRANFSAVYSTSTLNGIRAILMHGYPADHGGLTADEAHYATQLALWSWMYESADVGYTFYEPSRIRAGAGYNHVYNMYQNLLTYARNNNQNPGAFGISVSPSTVVLNNVGGQLQGTATVSFSNLNGNYSIDQSKLPAGVTVSPATGYNGQTITITSTSGFDGQTINMANAIIGHDSRQTGNIFWYEPNDTDYQNMVVFDMNFHPVAYSNLSFRVNTGNLSIIKSTQHNNGGVSGFTFEVRNSSNALIGTYTSTSTGKIDIPNLNPGWYSVREINLSTDFVEPTPNPVSVEVKAGQTVSVSFDNVKKRRILTVQKTDANFTLGGYSLSGAQFQVLDAGGTVVDTIITGADGRGQSKILPLGVYRIKETNAPYGFQLDPNTYTVPLSGTLGNGAIVYSPDTSIAEQPTVGRINLQKSNKNPMMGDYNLSSARYEVRAAEDIKRIDGSYYARTGDLVDTMITDADGKTQSKDLHLGKYIVKEVNAPYGYLLDTAAYDVTLSYGGQTVPVVYAAVNSGETPEPGRIRVHKYNESPSMGDYDLAGARFEVRADEDLYTRGGALIHAKGQLVDTVITDTNGNGESKDLPLGKYTVKESTAPWGYTVNTNTYPAVLSYGGQTVLISYTDTTNPQRPQTGKITLEKYDTTTDKRPQGDATLKGMVVEIYAAETLYDRKGNLIHSKDELLGTLYCGDNVSVTSKEFPLGNYYWKEKVPPTGYTLDQTPHPFSIEYSGQNITVNLLNRIQKNKVIEGKIALVKHTDQPDPDVQNPHGGEPPNPQVEEPLEGAIFQVYLKKSGSYDAALPTERALLTTNENGYCESGLLPYGVYVVNTIPE